MSETDDEESPKSKHKSGPPQKLAAAGLCIGVGSFSDPKDVPGMAHFLEHMVFMGSEKYPKENSFDEFIKQSGGSDNASTDAETTVFYFECLEKLLFEALDIFSQFFISPLMKREAMTREREAIESEFQIAMPSDSNRKEQLLCAFAKKDSPVNSFPWGNLLTLRDNVSDEDLYKGVHEFRKKHYSAHRMTLALQARLPLEELEKMVLTCFSKVPNNGLPPDDYPQLFESVFDTPEFNKIYYVKPVKDVCQVDITWAFPSLKDKYRSKPNHLISFLLGDEGKGSLLSYLKTKLWVLGTSIGNGETGIEHNSLYTFFTVNLNLTEEGHKHVNDVIEVIFSYIKMLKEIGPQPRIFEEVQAISNIGFKYSREETAVEIVEDLCEAMQFYPSEDYITGSELYFEFDPEAVSMILDQMTVDKANIMIVGTKPGDEIVFDLTEKWFGTKYSVRNIPESWKNQWNNPKKIPELSIPPPNTFITKDFTLLPDKKNNSEYPTKILQNSHVELWYRQDTKFKLPIAFYYFYLISPLSVRDARHICMLDMLVNLLAMAISEEIYPATSADLSHSFQAFEKGLVIKVYGFNEKLPILIELISKYLVGLNGHVTENMFLAVKDKLLKSYYNNLLTPSKLAKDIRLNLLSNNNWHPVDKYTALLEVSFQDMQNYITEFFGALYIKTLVQGNVSNKSVNKTVNKFIETLNCKELKLEDQPKYEVVRVNKGEQCCRIKSFGKNNPNSIITNYYQSGLFTIENSTIVDIILMIIEEPLFDILRTKEQLGYHVACSVRDTFGVLGYTITVNAQATKSTTQHVNDRIESFLKHTQTILKDLDEEEYNKIKNNLIKMKECADVHLKEEVERNWSEITSNDYLFDRLKQEVDRIRTTDLETIRIWWNTHNSFGDKENFRKLSIQIVGNTEEAVEEKEQPRLQFLSEEMDVMNEKSDKTYFINSIQEYKCNIPIFNKK